MTASDLVAIAHQFLDPLVNVLVAALAAYLTQKAIHAFQTHVGVTLTTQQRDTVLAAVKTAAGIIETNIDHGIIRTIDVYSEHGMVQAQASAVLNIVPQAAAAFGLNKQDVARMIVGAVDTGSRAALAAATGTGLDGPSRATPTPVTASAPTALQTPASRTIS